MGRFGAIEDDGFPYFKPILDVRCCMGVDPVVEDVRGFTDEEAAVR